MKCYKPDPRVYEHLVRKVRGKSGSLEEADREGIWLVSGNAFDIVGARACGLKTCWVDRSGGGWVDCLGELASGGPHVIVKGVDEAVKEILKRSSNY